MNKESIIQITKEFVKEQLRNAEGGHDWFHIERVWKTSKHIALEEDADTFIVELGALLHDIADSKFHNGDEDIGPAIARKFLQSIGADDFTIREVDHIIRHISFKGGHTTTQVMSTELKIVQDADRLDAIGAIGIARAFNYGGFKGRALYDPAIKPNLHMDKETYKNSSAPTINHFYEKLLLLKDRMNTKTGKKFAESRHEFMLNFLENFYKEWPDEI